MYLIPVGHNCLFLIMIVACFQTTASRGQNMQAAKFCPLFRSANTTRTNKQTTILQHMHKRFTALLEFVWDYLSRYQKGKPRKGKTNLELLEQEIVSGSGICWAVCKSAPHSRQPRQHPTTHFFTGRMPFLPPNKQRQSTEGTLMNED